MSLAFTSSRWHVWLVVAFPQLSNLNAIYSEIGNCFEGNVDEINENGCLFWTSELYKESQHRISRAAHLLFHQPSWQSVQFFQNIPWFNGVCLPGCTYTFETNDLISQWQRLIISKVQCNVVFYTLTSCSLLFDICTCALEQQYMYVFLRQ